MPSEVMQQSSSWLILQKMSYALTMLLNFTASLSYSQRLHSPTVVHLNVYYSRGVKKIDLGASQISIYCQPKMTESKL